MMMLSDVELEPAEERMLRLYEAAVELAVDLDYVPRWRRSERRRLEEDLNFACDLADEARDELAAAGGGYRAKPRPLRTILDDLRRQLDALP